jgi:hypothetical protein
MVDRFLANELINLVDGADVERVLVCIDIAISSLEQVGNTEYANMLKNIKARIIPEDIALAMKKWFKLHVRFGRMPVVNILYGAFARARITMDALLDLLMCEINDVSVREILKDFINRMQDGDISFDPSVWEKHQKELGYACIQMHTLANTSTLRYTELAQIRMMHQHTLYDKWIEFMKKVVGDVEHLHRIAIETLMPPTYKNTHVQLQKVIITWLNTAKGWLDDYLIFINRVGPMREYLRLCKHSNEDLATMIEYETCQIDPNMQMIIAISELMPHVDFHIDGWRLLSSIIRMKDQHLAAEIVQYFHSAHKIRLCNLPDDRMCMLDWAKKHNQRIHNHMKHVTDHMHWARIFAVVVQKIDKTVCPCTRLNIVAVACNGGEFQPYDSVTIGGSGCNDSPKWKQVMATAFERLNICEFVFECDVGLVIYKHDFYQALFDYEKKLDDREREKQRLKDERRRQRAEASVDVPTAIESTACAVAVACEPKTHIIEPLKPLETVFTTADRDAAYVRMLMHAIARKRIQFVHRDGEWNTVHNLAMFMYRCRDVLGAQYTDEIACAAYAHQHYDPKLATPYERAMCQRWHAAWKAPREEVIGPSGELVVLSGLTDNNIQPSKNMHAIACDIINEYLFICGLRTWYEDIDDRQPVHEDILHDCMRLSMIRFFNGWSRIDPRAKHLRNVLVHNFPPIDDILALEGQVCKVGHAITCGHVPTHEFTSALSNNKVHPCDNPRILALKALVRMQAYIHACEDKADYVSLASAKWNGIEPHLRIWVHHARAIESCILQIGEHARHCTFGNSTMQAWAQLCTQVRHVACHEQEYSPAHPEFIASMVKGMPHVKK